MGEVSLSRRKMVVSLLFMNGNGWREATFIVYFSQDIDTWFELSRYSVLQLESD